MNLNWRVKILVHGHVPVEGVVAAFADRQDALDWIAGHDLTDADYALTYKEGLRVTKKPTEELRGWAATYGLDDEKVRAAISVLRCLQFAASDVVNNESDYRLSSALSRSYERWDVADLIEGAWDA